MNERRQKMSKPACVSLPPQPRIHQMNGTYRGARFMESEEINRGESYEEDED
jgi:hypothetical protein